MKLYICNTPVTFPRSEYGGMVAVVARSPKHLGKILTEHYTKAVGDAFDLGLSVASIKAFELDPAKEYQEGIAMEFRT